MIIFCFSHKARASIYVDILRNKKKFRISLVKTCTYRKRNKLA